MGRKPHEESRPKADAKPETELDLVAEELDAIEAEDAARAAAERASGAAVVEPGSEAIERLEREALEWKDRALRASADFDNYRKRAIRERDEASGRGQAEAFAKIIDVIDDLARVAHLDPAQTSAESLHEGMLAIERKFIKTLEAAGLERIDPLGQRFDPRTQEAVTMQPAPDAEADQTVGAVFQHGYVYQGLLLRPARVAVLQWSGEASA
jgi:molecular chaperone GrpE